MVVHILYYTMRHGLFTDLQISHQQRVVVVVVVVAVVGGGDGMSLVPTHDFYESLLLFN
jgi:hypothetical protein